MELGSFWYRVAGDGAGLSRLEGATDLAVILNGNLRV
jgi:hypothetical protein